MSPTATLVREPGRIAAPANDAAHALPAFADPASATAWLADVPLLNIGAASAALVQQIERFNALECGVDTRIAVLEVLRPAVLSVQREHAKRFRGKQLPLTPVRRESLLEVARLWDALAHGYESCARSLGPDGEAAARSLAKVCHRAIDALIRKGADFHHSYVQVPPNDFALLHRLYLTAEHAGVARHRVRDPQQRDDSAYSCTHLYVRALLFEAAMPREHRPHILDLIESWLTRWAVKVNVLGNPPAAAKVPPLIVDLNQPGGARRSHHSGDPRSVRFLDMGAIAQSLEKRIQMLRQGRRPEETGLDGTVLPREGETLFLALHLQWCGGRIRRLSARQQLDSPAWVSTGLVAAHFYLSRRPFEQPGTMVQDGDDRAGDRVRAATDYMMASGIFTEEWLVRDESLGGIGLIRPSNEIGPTRLAHAQLVSARVRTRNTLLLGTIRWLQEVQDGGLHVGVQLLPGTPQPVAMQRAAGEKFQPAILLPSVAALNSPSSLLVAPGTFFNQQAVIVHDRERMHVQLTGLLEAGADFERVAFVPCMEPNHE